MFYSNKKYTHTEAVVISSLILAVAIGISYFKFYIPIAGMQSVRVALSGPFLRFIGVLFGPVTGGIASTLSDLIGYILNPTGPYFWPLTLTAFLNGFTTAFLWHTIKKINFKVFSAGYLSLFIILIVLGVFNFVFIRVYPSSAYAAFFEKRLDYISVGFIISGVTGIIVYLLSRHLLREKYEVYFERFIKFMVSVGIPGIILSTVNTFILIKSYGWSSPFIIIWIPRIVEQIFETLYSVSALVLFCGIYEKAFRKLD